MIKTGEKLKHQDLCENMITAAEDDIDIIPFIERGADIHYKKDLLLTKAAYNGNLDLLKYLVDKGCDIHTYNDYCLRYARLKDQKHILNYFFK